MNNKPTPNKFPIVIAILAFLLATFPIFVDIYRAVMFNMVPHDDYASYLLFLVGDGGRMPGAPYAYRILSVVVAIPFYYILPVFTFTNLPHVDLAYQKAAEAMSMVSYLSLVFTSLVIYAIARKQYAATRSSSIIVALLTFFLSGFISKGGVDPFAILIISILALWLEKPALFVPLIFISAVINEKIPIIFATMLAFRLATSAFQRRKLVIDMQLLASCLSVAAYFTIIFIFKLPGGEKQTNPALFLPHLYSSLKYALSMRGLFLNALPVLVLMLIMVLAILSRRKSAFHVSDISSFFILLIIAMLADVVYNIGRIVMYSFPLYLPATAVYFDEVLEKEDQSENKQVQ
jgi:hypothetical protein